MKKQTIDLGETPAQELSETSPDNEFAEPNYPSVMLSGDKRLHNLPDFGKHVITGKIISKHMPSKFNPAHRVEMEIHKIESPISKKKSNWGNDESAMSGIMADGK